ncbi:MAG: hypothetical protein KatS3mg002_0972 [Candidatus Woesearchaeota archaeon]|nr:MAG: hypothetical protein KatS3mg002_0972 [Candidatus Woesearchaeota archaeon]
MNLRTSKLICSKLNGSYFFMLKIILVLFIFISLVLPAYASLYVSHVEGSNQVKNFRKITDTVSFNISSTSDIVSINGVNPTCQKESMKYYCAVSDTRNEAVVSYNIINQEGESVTASINVDNSIGEITYVLNNSNGNVTLNYDVADKGYNGNELCSGLSMLEVWCERQQYR